MFGVRQAVTSLPQYCHCAGTSKNSHPKVPRCKDITLVSPESTNVRLKANHAQTMKCLSLMLRGEACLRCILLTMGQEVTIKYLFKAVSERDKELWRGKQK